MDSSIVTVGRNGNIAAVTIDRPPVNAVSAPPACSMSAEDLP
jgi:enoyl-CoA hydratase/carnithine racemase